MTRERILMVLGILVLIAPWSGLPLAWLEWVLPVIGLVVVAIGFTLRRNSSPTTLPPAPQPYAEFTERPQEPEPRSTHIAFS